MRKRQIFGVVILAIGIFILVFNILEDYHVSLGVFNFIYDIMDWFSFSVFLDLVYDSFSSLFSFISSYFWCLLLIVIGVALIFSAWRARQEEDDMYEGYYRHHTYDEEESYEPKPRRRRPLCRNLDDRRLLGVCSGIAACYGIDPNILRIGVLFLFFIFSTPVLLAYILLAFALPAEHLNGGL